MKSTIIISGSIKKSALSTQFVMLAESFVKNGYNVIFITDGKKKIEDKHDGIEYLSWPSYRPTKLADFLYALKIIRKNKPVATISNFGSVNIMIMSSWLLNVPNRICNFHTAPLQSRTLGISKWKKYRKKITYYLSTLIIFDSDGLKKDFIENFGNIHGKFKVLNNGVEKSEIKNYKKDGIIFTGRLEKIKGIEYLIKAMAIVVKQIPSAFVDLYGDGTCKPEYEELVKELGLEKNVLFRGNYRHDLLIEKYQHYKLAVLPSLGEGFPLSALEAIASGLPLIASNVGGLPDIVKEGINGYLVEPKDEKGLAEKILSLLLDSNKLRSFSENSLQIFNENYELGKIINKQVSFFHSLFNKNIK